MSKIDAPEIEPTAATVPVTPKKAPRPRGHYIDFTPRKNHGTHLASQANLSAQATNHKVQTINRPAHSASLSAQPSSRPAQISHRATPTDISTRRVSHAVQQTSVKIARSENKQGFVDGMPVAKNRPAPPATEVPLVKTEVYVEPVEEGLETEEDLLDPLADFADDEPVVETQEDFLADEDPDDYVETVLSQISESRTETTVRRSPFLKNYKIDKRPLSNRAPAREQVASTDSLTATPHEEFEEETFERKADSAPDNADELVATKPEKTGSKLGMFITVAITILLGAGVGVFVYLAFFQ